MEVEKEWFEEWFDTSYYHLLYNNRDFTEAELFIQNLDNHLSLPKHSKILDLACGKGRHALQLSELGYDVTGIDLSENSILEAKKMETSHLSFEIGDMRVVHHENYFDGVFNLFTSFGYFNSTNENLLVLKSISTMLKPGGVFVIDFMNSTKIIKEILEFDVIDRGTIKFNIQKKVVDKQIIKRISFEDLGKKFQFEERVQALTHEDFKNLISKTDLTVEQTFGNYHLEPFNENTSDRLILIGRKR